MGVYMKYDYDIVIIGGGAAGLTAAKTARGFGKKVALFEKMNRLGGECTWTGCIPSKALIKTAEIAWHAKHLKSYGLSSQVPIGINSDELMSYVRMVIEEDYKSHTPQKIEELGIDVKCGDVRFEDSHTICFNERPITFSKAIITTGSSPYIPDINGLSDIEYITNQNLFTRDRLPSSLLILGGGAIGCEMASALNRLGVIVTIIEQHSHILAKEDQEVVELLSQTLKDEGVSIITNACIVRIQKEKEHAVVTLSTADGEKHYSAEAVLVATGRKPNVKGLNLEAIGVGITEKSIVTDPTMRTSVGNIYAAGDVVGPYQFSHMAWYQGMLAARNAIIPFFKQNIDYSAIGWVTFTAPELARMGCTEDEARKKYCNITVYKKPYSSIDRAVTDRTSNGLAKYIIDCKGQLIGVHIVGARAGELLNEMLLARFNAIPLYKLGSLIHVYPTYSEINWHAGKQAYVDRLQHNWILKIIRRFMGM